MHEYQYFEDVNWGLLRLWGGRKGLRVLDVGCGYSTTSARIQDLGNDVTGIDSSPEIAELAGKRLSRVILANVLEADLEDDQYDVIIFADILEHLPWPAAFLQRYLKWLAPGGSVLVSMPNVGLWSVRLAHLAGRWEYQDTGVLDRTHLRFFTRRSARALIQSAGLTIARTTYNPGLMRPLVPFAKKFVKSEESAAPDALLRSKPYQLYLKTAYPVERAVASLWPGMLAFQMIFEAKR